MDLDPTTPGTEALTATLAVPRSRVSLSLSSSFVSSPSTRPAQTAALFLCPHSCPPHMLPPPLPSDCVPVRPTTGLSARLPCAVRRCPARWPPAADSGTPRNRPQVCADYDLTQLIDCCLGDWVPCGKRHHHSTHSTSPLSHDDESHSLVAATGPHHIHTRLRPGFLALPIHCPPFLPSQSPRCPSLSCQPCPNHHHRSTHSPNPPATPCLPRTARVIRRRLSLLTALKDNEHDPPTPRSSPVPKVQVHVHSS